MGTQPRPQLKFLQKILETVWVNRHEITAFTKPSLYICQLVSNCPFNNLSDSKRVEKQRWVIDDNEMGRVKRISYLSPMQAAKVQGILCIRAVSPEPPLLAHTSSESRETFRQKARSLAPLNGRACAVKIFHDGMLEDTNLLGAPQMIILFISP